MADCQCEGSLSPFLEKSPRVIILGLDRVVRHIQNVVLTKEELENENAEVQ